MKPGSTMFLKSVVSLIGIATLALCVFLLLVTISSEDARGFLPILVGIYIAAIPFFFALYQALKLLIYIDKSKAFSDLSVKALKNIKYCSIAISALYTAIMPYIINIADKDDAPGFTALGFVIIFASIVIAAFAALLQKLLQEALVIKTENELTV
ncbi:MAG: DUF2975 domain-containing protein [Planctomycetes bacterium]|nr:DUF2975 domain-containing protein [Planctomycetota bacterium]